MIGAGSSGIQVVPAIVSQVKSMDHYVRGKTWICSQFNETVLRERTAGTADDNFSYKSEEKEHWRENPDAYKEYRKFLESGMHSLYDLTIRGSTESKHARLQYEKNMRERLEAKPGLIDQLLPDFSPLCKRLTPGPGYLEALTEPHVMVISESLAYIDTDSITTTDGIRRPVDAIICATGFETSPGQGFPIYGRDGLNLRDKYKKRPKSYLGMCTDGFPNFFQSLGPNTWQGSGSLLIVIDYLHRYLAQILERLIRDNIATVEPRRKQVENFTKFCEDYFQHTVYTDDCVSWYKSTLPNATLQQRREAKVTALWPGSCLHAIQVMSSVRWEDFEIEVCGNSDENGFDWFGNGRTTAELDIKHGIDSDLTWYLNETHFVHEPKSW